MLPRKILRLLLFIGWVTVTIPYLMLKFNVRLGIASENAETWNNIGENIFLTLSTSLLFWGFTEFIASIYNRKKGSETEREFLNESLRLFNGYVHSLTGATTEPGEVLPSYIETYTNFQIDQLTDDWTLRSVVHSGSTREQLQAGSHRRIKGVAQNLKELRAEYDPYHSDFSKEFNRTFNDLMKALRWYLTDTREDSQQQGLVMLTVIRNGLIRLENVWRKKSGKQLMKAPEHVRLSADGKVRRVIV